LIEFRLKMARFGVLNTSNKWAPFPEPENIFTEDAIDAIYERSHGIPRAITNFCSDALIEAAFLRRKTIDAALVNEVIGRRVFTGADEDGRAVRQVQTTLAIPGGAGGVVSMDEARERRRA